MNIFISSLCEGPLTHVKRCKPHFLKRKRSKQFVNNCFLQGSDPGKYELIQKIQSLQKRLIAKTQELEERELLLQVIFRHILCYAWRGILITERDLSNSDS